MSARRAPVEGQHRAWLPAPALYHWARRTEPVVVVALEPAGTVRIIDRDGEIRHVDQGRIQFVQSVLATELEKAIVAHEAVA